jgi:RimJ/RimL family protein N-acetyltransferase
MSDPRAEDTVSLRPYAAGDLTLLARLLGDPAMTEHLGGPDTPDGIATRHERYLAADPETNGLFTIIVGPGGTPAGWVGFWEMVWEGQRAWECGWHALPEFHRRGIATAATALALADARARRRNRWMHAFPAADNDASNALCRTLGFTLIGEAEVEYPKGRTMRANHWLLDFGAP